MQGFWGGASRDDPRMKNRPVWRVPNYSRCCIPLRIHGGGAEMQNNDSLMTASFTSLLALGSTRALSFLIAGWPYSTTLKQQHD
eukprot:7485462-Pyramimonas_sp.AAC.1